MLLLALAMTSVGAAPNPFTGAWESTDFPDGSYQTISIGGGPGGSHHVHYKDFGASVCGPGPGGTTPFYAATAAGFLTESGNVLSGDLDVYCQYGPPAYHSTTFFTFTYDPLTDTLTDGFGYSVVWNRR
jgi:hypothetical protein